MNSASATAATAVVRPSFSGRRPVIHLMAACLAVTNGLACAQIVPIDWYRMGEHDAAAVVGQALSTTSDSIGTKPLALSGNITVQADGGSGSVRALQFSGASTDYGSVAPGPLTTLIDNVGIEAWVKPLAPATGADQVIAYNGYFGGPNPNGNGWGIVLGSDGKYYGQIGSGKFGGASATTGTWTHVAFVLDNGYAMFFVNGVAVGSPTLATPSTPTVGFGVGNSLPATTYGLHGLIDEVRVFTVVPGNFSPTQLLSSTKVVNTTNDSGAGSLRTALASAAENDAILISATGTITLASPLPIVTSGMTIFGPGTSNLSISGNHANRVFFVDATLDFPVRIGDLSVVNGAATGGAGGGGQWGGGGGMGAGGGLFVNYGNVVLNGVNFAGNSATGGNGGNSSAGCQCMGGGGGLGGAGGTASTSEGAGGGGGYLGAGGSVSGTNYAGSGGGGGITGAGGKGSAGRGGGGGAYNAGQDGGSTAGGNGADGLGGHGGTIGNFPDNDGGNGSNFGGGGGAGTYGNGGNGGRYGGGGGAASGVAGAGGDFGGSGGSATQSGYPLPGGFGGGSGGESLQYSGNGGFGGGSGGSDTTGGVGDGLPGPFGGRGGVGSNAAGGGGGGLGGAIFVRADNGGGFLTWNDGSSDAGTVIGGGAGTGCMGCASPGSAAGSSMFLLGGTTTINVSSGQQTIAGSIGGWSNEPPNITKTGAGTLVLSGGGSDLGKITLGKGELRVNTKALNLAAGKELDVNNTSTLSGALGSVNGAVVLASGGTIAPGDPANSGGVGTLSVGDLTWNSGGILAFQLGSTGSSPSDLLMINGNLNKPPSGSAFSFHFDNASGQPICGSTYTLVQFTGTTGFAATDFTFPYNGTAPNVSPTASSFAISGGQVQFTARCYSDQAITNFASTPANPVYGSGGTFDVSATPGASSSPLVFGSNTPVACSISGTTVTMNAHGLCTLTADQAGDTIYNPAPTVLLTFHFEQFNVHATASSAYGTIDPPTQQVDYNMPAHFVVVPQPGFTASVTGDNCTVTSTGGNDWATEPLIADCNVTADFSDRIFAGGFE